MRSSVPGASFEGTTCHSSVGRIRWYPSAATPTSTGISNPGTTWVHRQASAFPSKRYSSAGICVVSWYCTKIFDRSVPVARLM